MGIEAEKTSAIGSDDPERSTSSVGPQDDLVMYTGKVDAAEYGTLKRE
jgi:hypothetical protein